MKPLKPSFALILIGSVLFLNGASKSADQRPPKEIPQSNTIPENKKPEASKPAEKREHQQQPTSDTPFLAPHFSAKENARDSGYEKRQIEIQERIADYTWALVVVGAIIGFSQIVVLIFTYRTTNKAANAAQLSAEVARDLLTSQYRAKLNIENVYFGKKGGQVGKDPDINEIIIAYDLKNFGALPANGIVSVVIGRYGIGQGFRWPERRGTFPRASQEEFGFIIDPNKSARMEQYLLKPQAGSNPPIAETQWALMINGTIQVQIGIVAAYWDGQGNERITERWYLFDSIKRNWKPVLARQD